MPETVGERKEVIIGAAPAWNESLLLGFQNQHLAFFWAIWHLFLLQLHWPANSQRVHWDRHLIKIYFPFLSNKNLFFSLLVFNKTRLHFPFTLHQTGSALQIICCPRLPRPTRCWSPPLRFLNSRSVEAAAWTLFIAQLTWHARWFVAQNHWGSPSKEIVWKREDAFKKGLAGDRSSKPRLEPPLVPHRTLIGRLVTVTWSSVIHSGRTDTLAPFTQEKTHKSRSCRWWFTQSEGAPWIHIESRRCGS